MSNFKEVAFVIILVFSVTYGSSNENVALNKLTKQISTLTAYVSSRAIIPAYIATGSLTSVHPEAWWELDLRGYYTLQVIHITACSNAWTTFMEGAWVEVMDKDITLCPDVQKIWCGNISDTVAQGEVFNITCEPDFPVRFIRVYNSNNRLGLGFVDVRATAATKRYRSYYTPVVNRKVNLVHRATSAAMAGDCGIQCHKDHECLHFSYNPAAPFEETCLMTNKKIQFSVVSAGWTMYVHDDCL